MCVVFGFYLFVFCCYFLFFFKARRLTTSVSNKFYRENKKTKKKKIKSWALTNFNQTWVTIKNRSKSRSFKILKQVLTSRENSITKFLGSLSHNLNSFFSNDISFLFVCLLMSFQTSGFQFKIRKNFSRYISINT